jgi:hypothetical protein
MASENVGAFRARRRRRGIEAVEGAPRASLAEMSFQMDPWENTSAHQMRHRAKVRTSTPQISRSFLSLPGDAPPSIAETRTTMAPR